MTTTTTKQMPVGYIELVRENRRFRLLWIGQIISLLGDWFDLIASASLIAMFTQSGTAIGGLFVIRMLAPFLVSPFAGVMADRYNRKHLLIISDIIRGLTVLGFLLVRSEDDIWLIYVLSAIQLGLSGIFFPARNAILPDITTNEELGAANAISSTTWSVMLAFGAAIGGLFTGAFGIYPAFILDAITFFISAIVISRIVYNHQPALNHAERTIKAAFQQYIDGLHYLRQHFDILLISLQKAAGALTISSGFQVAQVVLAERYFVIGEGGSISMGLLYAVTGVGTGIGPIMMRRFTGDRDRPLRIAIAISYIIAAIGLVITGTLASFPIVLLGTLLRGIGGGIGWVFSTQLLLQLLPDSVRGRVFSTEFAMMTLMSAVGAAASGSFLDTEASVSTLLYLMAGLALIPALIWTIWILWGKPASSAPDELAIDSANQSAHENP